MEDGVKLKGKVQLVLTGPDGQVKENREIDNLVVTTGLNFIASRMNSASATVMSHMAVGTGSTAAALGQTALVTESARVSTTTTYPANAGEDNKIKYQSTFGSGVGTGALVEAGVFNAASSGTMLCRTVFSVINKGAADSLTITWTITIS